MKQRKPTKLIYVRKGKYSDGRGRIVIKNRGKSISKALPKPEILWNILDTIKQKKVSDERKP